MKTLELTVEQQKNFRSVIQYLLDSERKSYEEYIRHDFDELLDENQTRLDFIFGRDFYNRPEINHIYAIACRLNDAMHIKVSA